jgi:hypothetical protein
MFPDHRHRPPGADDRRWHDIVDPATDQRFAVATD